MHRLLRCALIFCSASLFAGDAREDWAAAIALDAGPGVKPKTAAEAYALAMTIGRGSLGLVNMRERAEAMGGTLRVSSKAGKGTRLRLTFPI